jgi:putative ABC transport system ATP-binding protein
METLISLSDVWKVYQMGDVEVPALKGVSLSVDKGDFVAIIGASGSGKSTMANLIGCLDTPSRGEIILKGRAISKLSESDLAVLRGQTIGFIFQQYNLMQSMTAFENVLLPLELREVGDSEAKERAINTLNLVGLADKMHSKPSQLSGGQQQRVSIARCLVGDPEIILADEPTGALDSKTGIGILGMLQKLWKEKNKTVIMITHDLNLARCAHRLVELEDGQIIRNEINKEMRILEEKNEKN